MDEQLKQLLQERAWERSTSTKDGVKVELGLRVVDYDRKHGEVIAEYDGSVGINYGTDERPDHWFRVRRDDGSENSFTQNACTVSATTGKECDHGK